MRNVSAVIFLLGVLSFSCKEKEEKKEEAMPVNEPVAVVDTVKIEEPTVEEVDSIEKPEEEPCSPFDYVEQQKLRSDSVIHRLMTDKSTMRMPIRKLEDEDLRISIVESNDKKIRVYSWRDPESTGSMGFYENVIQYISNGKVKTFHGSFDMMENPDNAYGDMSSVSEIYSLGNTGIYIIEEYSQGSGMWSAATFSAIKLKDGKFVKCKLFKEKDSSEYTSEISIGYNSCKWFNNYRIKESDDNKIFFNKNERLCYIFNVNENQEITGLYDTYKIEDNHFVYQSTKASPKLHKSLRDFKQMMCMFKTGKYLVRLDRLPDETVRFAMWIGKKKSQLPDVVIQGEKFDPNKEIYTFNKGTDEYQLKFEDADYINRFIIRRNGKTELDVKP